MRVNRIDYVVCILLVILFVAMLGLYDIYKNDQPEVGTAIGTQNVYPQAYFPTEFNNPTEVAYAEDFIEEIEVPEETLIEFTTGGVLKDNFKPVYFIKISGTDLSKCFVDGRLRINLNGEVYWIRLEKDCIIYMPTIQDEFGWEVKEVW